MRYQFTLKGETSLLMHADDIAQSDDLTAWRKAPENKKFSVAGDDRSPGWSWMTYLYSDGEVVCMPSDNIAVALRTAGSKMTFKRQETFKKITQSGLFFPDDYCEFLVGGKAVSMASVEGLKPLSFAEQAKAVKPLGFSLLAKRAKVGDSKHVRVRPRFDDWSVIGTVEIIDTVISEEILSQLFTIAGAQSGLCDWRPSSPKSPGPYGRFTAKLKRMK